MEQNFRQTLKEILRNAYQNNNDLFVGDIAHIGLLLAFHNRVNVQNRLADVNTQRQHEKYSMLDRISHVQCKIDQFSTKDVVKAVSILNEKGVLSAIEFIESIQIQETVHDGN